MFGGAHVQRAECATLQAFVSGTSTAEAPVNGQPSWPMANALSFRVAMPRWGTTRPVGRATRDAVLDNISVIILVCTWRGMAGSFSLCSF